MQYGIVWCYLPSGRGDIPAFSPAKLSRYSIERRRRCAGECDDVNQHTVTAPIDDIAQFSRSSAYRVCCYTYLLTYSIILHTAGRAMWYQ